MMADWANDDKKLLTWREETGIVFRNRAAI